MILLACGFILGAALAAIVTRIYNQRELSDARHDLGLLQARLRSLARLLEAGFIEPKSVEAAGVLNEIHDLALEPEAESEVASEDHPQSARAIRDPVESDNAPSRSRPSIPRNPNTLQQPGPDATPGDPDESAPPLFSSKTVVSTLPLHRHNAGETEEDTPEATTRNTRR